MRDYGPQTVKGYVHFFHCWALLSVLSILTHTVAAVSMRLQSSQRWLRKRQKNILIALCLYREEEQQVWLYLARTISVRLKSRQVHA